jgi:predicted enzyme related to lactoylglutathione lyase
MDRRTLIAATAAGIALSTANVSRAAVQARELAAREIMALGWYVVFSPPSSMDQATDFYGRTLGLPLMMTMRTPQQNKNYFWCGEDIVLDLSHHAPEAPFDPRDSDPATARQVPIFRTEDLGALMATFLSRGAKVLPARPTPFGREAFVVDPTGRLIGFRQRDPDSPLAADREARRRFKRGEAFNPGCASMPPHLQELGWVRLRVSDLDAAKQFYGSRVGLAYLGSTPEAVLFDLGDNTTLEIAGGGVARPLPTAQNAADSVMILRVVDFQTMLRRLKAAGQAFPFKIYNEANGGFSYIADTDGNLLGLADRRPPAAYRGEAPVLPEDLEARRRWVEATAGGS